MVQDLRLKGVGNMEILSHMSDEHLTHLTLTAPWEEITITREMRRFKAPLGLTPNIPGIPSANLAAAILLGRVSFTAVIRRELGDVEFRNLRNYAQGKVKNPRALGVVLSKLGGSQATLEAAASVLRNPQDADHIKSILGFEALIYGTCKALKLTPVLCPCCGENMIQSSDHWWSKQPCKIGTKEAEFIDRACTNTIVMHSLQKFIAAFGKREIPSLKQLSEPAAHPFANWLQYISKLYRAPSLSHLAARAGTNLKPESILRFSRGEVLPPEAIEQLLRHIPNSAPLKASVLPARALAFAIDLLRSSTHEPISEEVAREIISSRVDALREELRVAIYSRN